MRLLYKNIVFDDFMNHCLNLGIYAILGQSFDELLQIRKEWKLDNYPKIGILVTFLKLPD